MPEQTLEAACEMVQVALESVGPVRQRVMAVGERRFFLRQERCQVASAARLTGLANRLSLKPFGR